MSYKTLVIQPLPDIGDMLWYLPYIKAIARNAPDQRVSILTKSTVQLDALLGHEEFLDECLMMNSGSSNIFGFMQLIADLRSRKYNSVWILHHSPRYGFLSRLAGIPYRNGYGFGLQKKFLTASDFIEEKFIKEGPQARAKALLKLNNIDYNPVDQFFKPSHQALMKITDLFKNVPHKWIVFGIGASQEDKCWHPDNFVHLAKRLTDYENYSIFLACSFKESQKGKYIFERVQDLGCNVHLVSDLSLDQVTALISKADFYVGNCSGPLNIAACLNITSFGLFGATPPLNYTQSLIPITPPMADKHKGMDSLSVESVFSKIISVIKPKEQISLQPDPQKII